MHDKLFDKLCSVLDDMERKEKLSASDIQIIDWVTHAKKSMLATDEMMGDGYSGNSYYSNSGNSGRYSREGSYARKRDSMGRYSREGRSSYRGYSRNGKEDFLEEMRAMMDSAPDEMTRQNIQRMINQMEQD